ncbi:MAG TPA: hypothetical protein PLB99_11725 [Thermotogota bacterium]|nr:hypothetical protein [Thermotogota bacterium]
MEKYRKILRKRIYLMAIAIITAAILLLLQVSGLLSTKLESEFSTGMVSGFQSGLLTALIAVFTVVIVRYQKALKDKMKLQLLYNRENDERKKIIKQKSGGNIVIFYSVVIVFAAIIAGYFNTTVFHTLVACALFQLVVSSLLKLYYLKKY